MAASDTSQSNSAILTHMYKRPSKRAERARLFALYTFMTSVVAIAVVLFLLVVTNYRYNHDSGRLEQRSLIQFASTPSGAYVSVDERLLSSRTSTKSTVSPGKHTVEVSRQGYHSWEVDVVTSRGELVWLDYVRLVPKQLKVESIAKFGVVTAGSTSPDKKQMIFHTKKPSFIWADISQDEPAVQELKVPDAVLETVNNADKKSSTPKYKFGSWSKDKTKVLAWQDDGKSKDLLLINVKSPKRSLNLSREFSIDVVDADFSTKSDNLIYLQSNNQVRQYSTSDNVISKSLLENVASFRVNKGDDISFETLPEKEAGMIDVELKLNSTALPVKLMSRQENQPAVQVASDTYFGERYTAISQGNRFELYKGKVGENLEGMEVVASRTFNESIESIEFNVTASQMLLRFSNSYIGYSMDRNLFSPRVELGKARAKDVFWIDGMHIGLIDKGVLTMRDIDGTNEHEINTVQSNTVATLSRKGSYFYSIGEVKDSGKVTGSQLQRVRMTVR